MRPAAFVMYAAAAFLMSSYMILDRRISWQPSIMLWFTAVCFNMQPDVMSAFTMLAFTLAIGLVFRCDTVPDARRQLFSLFAAATTFAVFFPQFVIVLPMLLIYPAMSGKLGGQSFMAALLGVATPVWLFGGLIYLFPGLLTLLEGHKEHIEGLLHISKVELTLPVLTMLAAELVIMVPAIARFALSASSEKVRLRRRMLFCIMLDIVLWAAGWWRAELFSLFFIWRLPLLSLLAAYIFPVLPQKTSNIYLLSTLLLWLSAAIIELWIG